MFVLITFRKGNMNQKLGTKNHSNKTDWTTYYERKRSFFSTFTQRSTLEMINKFYDMTGYASNTKSNSIYSVIELGGGNSCFAGNFCERNALQVYDIIDNNNLSVQLFEKMKLRVVSHKGLLINLTEYTNPKTQYDFVYSIGLIEHFDPAERSMVIKNHFQYCKNKGYVLISFPTPTRKYRFWRKVMEILGLWQFWDETPLYYKDVKQDIEKYGNILKVELNKKLFLTQMLIFAKKHT